ncbi:MAG: hypothetical protein ACI9VM_000672 [Candidatus Azotimanducaceae bacterium]|jgi:uncharacterized protein YgbK (DUF1537 family)
MKAKSLLIPVAAFAVSVTGVSAFNGDILEKAGLSNEQISAFEEAHALREEGNREAARDVLLEAGVDTQTMESIREAMHEHRKEMKGAIHDAVENNDFEAFKEASEGSPLSEIITTDSDFDLFVEAYILREEGDKDATRAIMEDLGFEGKMHGHRGMHGNGVHGKESRTGGGFKGRHAHN